MGFFYWWNINEPVIKKTSHLHATGFLLLWQRKKVQMVFFFSSEDSYICTYSEWKFRWTPYLACEDRPLLSIFQKFIKWTQKMATVYAWTKKNKLTTPYFTGKRLHWFGWCGLTPPKLAKLFFYEDVVSQASFCHILITLASIFHYGCE